MSLALPLARVELVRQIRNPYTLVFTLLMPLAMYLLFGVGLPYGDETIGNGNVRFYIMVSMAAAGAATAMASVTSLGASERRQGWGRQLALTPMTTTAYVASKLIVALGVAALAVVVLFATGAMTGAEAVDGGRWLACGLIVVLGSALFGLWGIGVGLLFNPDSAPALASIAITFFAFLGNVYMPLSGVMLTIAKFTPMYGYVALSRWPLTGGELTTGDVEPLWVPLLNVAVWAVFFSVLVSVGLRRGTRRS